MFCSPMWCLRALRNHTSLNARVVYRLMSPDGMTSGAIASGLGAKRRAWARADFGRASRGAWSPRPRMPRPMDRPRAVQSIQATE